MTCKLQVEEVETRMQLGETCSRAENTRGGGSICGWESRQKVGNRLGTEGTYMSRGVVGGHGGTDGKGENRVCRVAVSVASSILNRVERRELAFECRLSRGPARNRVNENK
jgi:hypothetical protein